MRESIQKTDAITKFCMAYNYISDGKNRQDYEKEANCLGDYKTDKELQELKQLSKDAKLIYETLSKCFTDEEISLITNILQECEDEAQTEFNSFVK